MAVCLLLPYQICFYPVLSFCGVFVSENKIYTGKWYLTKLYKNQRNKDVVVIHFMKTCTNYKQFGHTVV